MPTITPFLWYNDQAEEAMNFYCSVFKNSKPGRVSRAGGKVMSVTFQLEGQEFMALNGGPTYHFTPAISLFVSVESQAEVDQLWAKLSVSKSDEQCGWLKDKFGLSWQIIPTALGRMLGDKDPAKVQRVVAAMLKMKKIEVAGLERAYAEA